MIDRHFDENDRTRVRPIIDNLLDNIISFLNDDYESENLEDVKVIISEKNFEKIETLEILDDDLEKMYQESNCNICFENYIKNDTLKKLNCNHIFHKDCLYDWLCKEKVTCPTCRKDVRENV